MSVVWHRGDLVAAYGGLLTRYFDHGVGTPAQGLHDCLPCDACLEVVVALFAQWDVVTAVADGQNEQTTPI